MTSKNRMLRNNKTKNLWGYVFISPWLLGFLIFTAGPMLASLFLSLTRYDGRNAPVFIGFGNFVKMFKDHYVWNSLLKVTLKFSMLSIPIGIICGFLLAYLLNMKVAGMKAWRTLYYLPSLISGVVIAMLWRGLFDDQYGIINYVIRQFGGSAPKWLLDPKYTLYCFLFLSVWSCGGSMIIYLSGLQGIPTELYEAAELDGCNKWQQMIHVTIPQMTPIFFYELIMGIIGSFQYFAEPMVLTKGGPAHSTEFFNLYLYNNAFKYQNMGYASALAWFLFVIILILTLLVFKSSDLWVFYDSEVKK